MTKDTEKIFSQMLAQCLSEMDEHERSRYDANAKVCAKKLAKAGLAAPLCDMAKARAALVEWNGDGRYLAALRKVGISQGDMLHGRELDADLKAVFVWLWGKREKVRAERVQDEVDELHEVAMELARDTEGVNKVNPKLVTELLSKLDRANMGDEKGRDGVSGKGKVSVTYNVPGLTVNMITAPGKLAEMAGGGGMVVDVVDGAAGAVGALTGGEAGGGCWQAALVDKADRAGGEVEGGEVGEGGNG